MVTKKQRREALADTIETIRKQRGSTKRHVYTAARMSQGTYDSRLAGKTDFTFSEIIDIAEALGVTVSELTALDDAAELAKAS
jgi:transcriptional regulator with XRE-family HTH domain